jgi:hypothetical protein
MDEIIKFSKFLNHNDLEVQYEPYRLTKDLLDYITYKYLNKWIFNYRVSKALFNGSEVLLFVNKFLNDRAFYDDQNNILASIAPEILRFFMELILT